MSSHHAEIKGLMLVSSVAESLQLGPHQLARLRRHRQLRRSSPQHPTRRSCRSTCEKNSNGNIDAQGKFHELCPKGKMGYSSKL